MIQRPVPVADRQAVRDRAGDVVGRVAAPRRERVPEREAARRARRQTCSRCRACAASAGADAETRGIASVEQQVDDRTPSKCPPLTTTAPAPRSDHRRAASRASSRVRRVRPSRTSASMRLGVTTVRARHSSRRIAATASSSSSWSPLLATITGSTTTCGQAQRGERRGHGLDDGGVGEHAGLDRIDARCRRRRRRSARRRGPAAARDTPTHRLRVLRRDRRDGAGAVDAVGGKRLQVGLDAGAAAGIAARNCQCCDHTLESGQYATHPAAVPPVHGRVAGARRRRQLRHADQDRGDAVCAVLTAAASQISVPLPFTPVPFTLQPMVVLLGGALLGPRLGLAAPDPLSGGWHRRPACVCGLARRCPGRARVCSVRPAAT